VEAQLISNAFALLFYRYCEIAAATAAADADAAGGPECSAETAQRICIHRTNNSQALNNGFPDKFLITFASGNVSGRTGGLWMLQAEETA